MRRGPYPKSRAEYTRLKEAGLCSRCEKNPRRRTDSVCPHCASEYDAARYAVTGPPGRKKKSKRGYVYFVQAGVGGPVKIGMAASVDKRLADLQQAHYEQLVLLACFASEDCYYDEQELQKRFSNLRIRGEWFRPGAELLNYVKENTHG